MIIETSELKKVSIIIDGITYMIDHTRCVPSLWVVHPNGEVQDFEVFPTIKDEEKTNN